MVVWKTANSLITWRARERKRYLVRPDYKRAHKHATELRSYPICSRESLRDFKPGSYMIRFAIFMSFEPATIP